MLEPFPLQFKRTAAPECPLEDGTVLAFLHNNNTSGTYAVVSATEDGKILRIPLEQLEAPHKKEKTEH